MRRPKRIVIIDPHADRQGITRLTLWANKFDAVAASSISGAREILRGTLSADLLLAYWPIDEAWLEQLGHQFQVPTLYMASRNATAYKVSDATLDMSTTKTAALIEQIKLMTARKRGPKPKEVIPCPSLNQSATSAVA
jgi:hypothetical protein